MQRRPTRTTARQAPAAPERRRTLRRARLDPGGRKRPRSTPPRSRRPREPRRGESRVPLVLDPKRIDLRARRMSHRQLGPSWMEDAGEPRRLAGLDPERYDVLDLEVDGVAN